jgi:hypothetical protein
MPNPTEINRVIDHLCDFDGPRFVGDVSELQEKVWELCVTAGFNDEQCNSVVDVIHIIEAEMDAEAEDVAERIRRRMADTKGDNE